MFGVDIIDYDGKMAVAVAKRIGLVAIEIDGQFDLEGRGGMTQIDQREIRELEMIGNFKAEGARVEIQRFRLVEHADHRVNGFCHSVQLLEMGDDGGAGLRFGLAVGDDGAGNNCLRVLPTRRRAWASSQTKSAFAKPAE